MQLVSDAAGLPWPPLMQVPRETPPAPLVLGVLLASGEFVCIPCRSVHTTFGDIKETIECERYIPRADQTLTSWGVVVHDNVRVLDWAVSSMPIMVKHPLVMQHIPESRLVLRVQYMPADPREKLWSMTTYQHASDTVAQLSHSLAYRVGMCHPDEADLRSSLNVPLPRELGLRACGLHNGDLLLLYRRPGWAIVHD
jgi:hypothetical protein